MHKRLLFAGVSVLFVGAFASGCFISDSDDTGDTCQFNNQIFEQGDQFTAGDGCNTCTCGANGAISCTEIACQTGCSYNGQLYQSGDSFNVDCNTCTCEASGSVACTNMACTAVTCEYDSMTYDAGDSFDATDGCNTCTCDDDGSGTGIVACTELACPADCTYNMMDYDVGDMFPAIDGCNTCSCDAVGEVNCTMDPMCP